MICSTIDKVNSETSSVPSVVKEAVKKDPVADLKKSVKAATKKAEPAEKKTVKVAVKKTKETETPDVKATEESKKDEA